MTTILERRSFNDAVAVLADAGSGPLIYLFRSAEAFDQLTPNQVRWGLPAPMDTSSPMAVFTADGVGWAQAEAAAKNLPPGYIRLQNIRPAIAPMGDILREAGCLPRKGGKVLPTQAEVCDHVLWLIEALEQRDNLPPQLVERILGFIDAIMWAVVGVRQEMVIDGQRLTTVPALPGSLGVVVPSTGRGALAFIRVHEREMPVTHEVVEFLGRWCRQQDMPVLTDDEFTYVYSRIDGAVRVFEGSLQTGDPQSRIVDEEWQALVMMVPTEPPTPGGKVNAATTIQAGYEDTLQENGVVALAGLLLTAAWNVDPPGVDS